MRSTRASAPTLLPPPRRRLRLECLEDRCTPASFTVMNNSDTGMGSLRQAIADANLASGPHTISFAGGVTGAIQLQSQLPALSESIDINGPGSSVLSVTGLGGAGGADFRLFVINAGVSCSITDLMLSGGYRSTGNGGAILNNGTLTLTSVEMHTNESAIAGGAIYNSSTGSMTIGNCDIRCNQATNGGAILNAGDITITTTEIYSNGASGSGGAIANLTGATLVLSDTEIYANYASGNGGGVSNGGSFSMTGGKLYYNGCGTNGGGIFNSGTASFDSVPITANSADKGGGFYVANGLASFTSLTISGNSSFSDGTKSGGTWDATLSPGYTFSSVTLTDNISSF